MWGERVIGHILVTCSHTTIHSHISIRVNTSDCASWSVSSCNGQDGADRVQYYPTKAGMTPTKYSADQAQCYPAKAGTTPTKYSAD